MARGVAQGPVGGGTLDLQANSQQFAGVQVTGGTLQNGTVTLNTGNYDLQAGTVSVVLAGSAGIAKSGTGSVTLSGTNTYSGSTSITAGALIATNASALGSTAAGTTISSGANPNTV